MTLPILTTLTSWGRALQSESRLWPVEAAPMAIVAVRAAGARGAIARGLARSYGDACLNSGGEALDMRQLRRILSFDSATGVIQCEAGVSFREVMDATLPSGWMPAVCPGTAFVTMGGAVANDVHGKNQHVEGSFGEHVDWLDLLTSDGEVRRVSPTVDAELFTATVGGVGLTGVILRLQFRLMRVPSNAVELERRRVMNIHQFVEMLAESVTTSPYVVGWVDAMSSGQSLGRGILEIAHHSQASMPATHQHIFRVPVQAPAWALSRLTMRPFNFMYFHRVPRSGDVRLVDTNRFLYPLDALLDWNRLYGPRGIVQFQCVVPVSEGSRAIPLILAEAKRLGGSAFLAVIKAPRKAGTGLMSFALPGYSLALDFPLEAHTGSLLSRLHEVTIEYGGRVYLAKDSLLTAEQLPRMYPALNRFRQVLHRVDPLGIMQSDMARRLRLQASRDE